jgi:hypothetical protein
MMFASLAARDVGVPDVTFFTASACGLMGYMQFQELVDRGLVPLKGSSTVNVFFLVAKINVLPTWWFGSHS